MGKRRKQGECGAATSYISRNRALKKLQLSLPDFRRLCILKGIYPHEPKNLKKVNKGSTALRTFYYTKDIQFLAHEPLLEKFRDFKGFMKRVKKAVYKDDPKKAEMMLESKPVYTLDHIVRERYPTFTDALRDIDDALAMLFLFSSLPQYRKIQAPVVNNCKRLCVEFMHYLIESKSLQKVFLSIKGIYFQAEVEGQTVTWVTPYQYTQQLPSDVDFRVMLTFVEFYATLVGFINLRLFHSLNIKYPPQIEGLLPPAGANDMPSQVVEEEGEGGAEMEDHAELLSSLGHSLARVIVPESQEEMEEEDIPMELSAEETELRAAAREREEREMRFKNLFTGCKFFLAREVPREALTFAIRCFGGEASWDSTLASGSTYPHSNDSITHQVVDRPQQTHRFLGRDYIQPQWVFDCINRQRLLPTTDYSPSSLLPPHLSPFVDEGEEDYMPPERARQLAEDQGTMETDSGPIDPQQIITEDVRRETVSVEKPRVGTVVEERGEEEEEEEGDGEEEEGQSGRRVEKERREEKRLAVMMMTKKRKRLYDKILKAKKMKAAEVRELKKKRQEIDSAKQTHKITSA